MSEPAAPPPPPRANPELAGHEAAEATLRRWFDTRRLPHALLLTGPRGIGKATLAFRFARFILSGGAGDMFGGVVGDGLAIDRESGVFHRVASGGHADLLTVERAYDLRRKRLRGEIVIDDTREIGAFLHLTPAEGGWRVVVVDGAETMNRNAANALLKVLEEPPRRTLLLLVTHSPGRLLPTIRSRCQRLALSPLPPPLVCDLLARYRPDLDAARRDALVKFAEGSIGRALELSAAGGVELYQTMLNLLSRRPGIDPVALYGFADRLVRSDAEEAYRAAEDLLGRLVARLAAAAARGGADNGAGAGKDTGENAVLDRFGGRVAAARWAAIGAEIAQNFARTDGLNLDRKQAMVSAFFAIDAAAG